MECESYMSAQYHFAVPRQEGTIGYFRSSYQKLSSFVSDLLGLSARRMLKALAEGETNPAALAALADARYAGAIVRRARCVHRPPARLPAAPEHGARAVAIPRAADRPTGPGNGQSAPSAPGCRPAAGGGAGTRSGFRATDHC